MTKGSYDDHAVRYRKNTTATTAMRNKNEQINRIREETTKELYLESAKAQKTGKSEYVTCPECGSKINIPALIKYHGEDRQSCLLCAA